MKLLAVSKNQAVEKILSAVEAGQFCFGENYLQEALSKIPLLPKSIEWHFIGPIQSNKTRKIAEHFAWVQSVDNIDIAKRLNDQRPANLPPLNICIQVNISKETSKSGVAENKVRTLIEDCSSLSRLTLRGLMAIPAFHAHFVDQRKTFHLLFSLWSSLCQQGLMLDTLSMGMSADVEAAIAEGSTLVRLGTALFGARN